jgi:hypothetical protein
MGQKLLSTGFLAGIRIECVLDFQNLRSIRIKSYLREGGQQANRAAVVPMRAAQNKALFEKGGQFPDIRSKLEKAGIYRPLLNPFILVTWLVAEGRIELPTLGL